MAVTSFAIIMLIHETKVGQQVNFFQLSGLFQPVQNIVLDLLQLPAICLFIKLSAQLGDVQVDPVAMIEQLSC